MDGETLNPEDRSEGISVSPNLEIGRRDHPAHTNNLTGISASEYFCKAEVGKLEIQTFVKFLNWFLGN